MLRDVGEGMNGMGFGGVTVQRSDGGPHTAGASPGQRRGERTVQTRRLREGCALGGSGMCSMILDGWMDGLETREVVGSSWGRCHGRKLIRPTNYSGLAYWGGKHV